MAGDLAATEATALFPSACTPSWVSVVIHSPFLMTGDLESTARRAPDATCAWHLSFAMRAQTSGVIDKAIA
jgi:hypothetical protein